MCIRDRGDVKSSAGMLRSANSEVVVELDNQFRSLEDILNTCLLYTSDAADERSSVDLGGRRIIKKKNRRPVSQESVRARALTHNTECRHTHTMMITNKCTNR